MGAGLTLLGIVGVSAFQSEVITLMQPGQTDMELNERLAKIRAHYRQVKETISELMIDVIYPASDAVRGRRP